MLNASKWFLTGYGNHGVVCLHQAVEKTPKG